jgi:hypothetical protein
VAESAGSVTLNGSPDLSVPEVVPNGEVTGVELVAVNAEVSTGVELSPVGVDDVDALFVQLTNRTASSPHTITATIIFFFMFFLTFKPRFSPPQSPVIKSCFNFILLSTFSEHFNIPPYNSLIYTTEEY